MARISQKAQREIARRMAMVRADAGLRQKDFVELLADENGDGWSDGYVSNIEQGKALPSQQYVRAICSLTDQDESALLPEGVTIAKLPIGHAHGMSRHYQRRRHGTQPDERAQALTRVHNGRATTKPTPEEIEAFVKMEQRPEENRTPEHTGRLSVVTFIDDGDGPARGSASAAAANIHLRLHEGLLTLTWPDGSSLQATEFDGMVALLTAFDPGQSPPE